MLRDALKGDPQIEALRRVIKVADPDILLLADVDYDLEGHALTATLGPLAQALPHRFARLPNKGRWRADDGDGDGRLGEPEDREAYGPFAGAGGAAMVSKFPLQTDRVVDLTDMLWRDLPGGLHGDDLRADLRLSTTMHWDVPVELPDGQQIRLWAWHATAPVFDGPEDANGRRNRDEAQLWLNRLNNTDAAVPVILIGVANLDPVDGEGRADALSALLAHPRLIDPKPESVGGLVAAEAGLKGDPALHTVAWPPPGPGNRRVDFILPDRAFRVVQAGVLWPDPNDPAQASLSRDVSLASRHRLVWVDLELQR